MRKKALLVSLFCLALIGLPAGFFTTLPTTARESTWRITIRANPDWTFDAVFPFHGGLSGVEFFEYHQDIPATHILGYINPYGEVVIPIIHPHSGPWYTYRGAPHFAYGAAAIYSSEHWAAAIFDSSGQQLTDFIFGDARNFADELVAVRDNQGWVEGRWGFADTSGEIVIPMVWEHAGDFVNGLAPVAIDASWVLIDRAGDIAVHLNIDVVQPPPDGEPLGLDFTYGVSRVMDMDEDWFGIFSVIDIDGNVIVPAGRYNFILPYSEGLAAARDGDWETGIWSYIDTTGEVVIPPNPDWLAPFGFNDGLAAVIVGDRGQPHEWRWGFINTKGEFVIPPVFAEARAFNDGLAAVRVHDPEETLWGIIDTSGAWVIEPQYSQVSDFSEGLIWLGAGEPVSAQWDDPLELQITGGDMQWSIAAVERVRPEYNTRHGLIDRIMRLLRR